jgi:hypothetical protein
MTALEVDLSLDQAEEFLVTPQEMTSVLVVADLPGAHALIHSLFLGMLRAPIWLDCWVPR